MGTSQDDKFEDLGCEDGARYKLLVCAACIADGARVTKRTGRKPYVLRRSVTAYGCSGNELLSKGESKQVVARADENTVLLIDDQGNINACSANTELVWELDEYTLRELLDNEVSQ